MNQTIKFYLSILALASGLNLAQKAIAQEPAGSCRLLGADRHASATLAARVYTNAYPAYPNQFYNDWQPADIYLANGKVMRNQRVRYNGHIDEMVWQRTSDQQTGSLVKSTVKEVRFAHGDGQSPSIFRNMEVKLPMYLNPSNIYMEVLVEGSISLYCYRRVKMVKNTPALFYEDYQYVLQYRDALIPVSLRRSSLLSAFSKPERKAFIELMRENKWRFRREGDVVKGIQRFMNK